MQPATKVPQPALPDSRRRLLPHLVAMVAAGLEPDGTPYLCGMDSIGAQETAKDFMVAGTATDSLLGICESLWRPDLVRGGSGRLGRGDLTDRRAWLLCLCTRRPQGGLRVVTWDAALPTACHPFAALHWPSMRGHGELC